MYERVLKTTVHKSDLGAQVSVLSANRCYPPTPSDTNLRAEDGILFGGGVDAGLAGCGDLTFGESAVRSVEA